MSASTLMRSKEALVLLLQEPSPSDYDLRFSVAGIPVRVHPLFWLVALILGAGGDLAGMLIWIGVLFVSILIHELGHAAAARYFGWEPWIVLYGFGGLTRYQPHFTPSHRSYARAGNSSWGQIAISLAGPAAGFLFALSAVAGLYLSERSLTMYYPGLTGPPGSLTFGKGPTVTPPNLRVLVASLLMINFFWTVINLLPISGLDGGHVAREVMMMIHPGEGVRMAYMLSMGVAALAAVYALVQVHSIFLTILFAVLGYDSYRALERYSGRGW
jgi:Zn-dependent protease